jgi:hypothetical protein
LFFLLFLILEYRNSQLFSKALNNLGIIMGTTALCLIVQCVLLVLDFAFGTSKVKFSDVSIILFG